MDNKLKALLIAVPVGGLSFYLIVKLILFTANMTPEQTKIALTACGAIMVITIAFLLIYLALEMKE